MGCCLAQGDLHIESLRQGTVLEKNDVVDVVSRNGFKVLGVVQPYRLPLLEPTKLALADFT